MWIVRIALNRPAAEYRSTVLKAHKKMIGPPAPVVAAPEEKKS